MFLTYALKIDPNYIAARARVARCHEIFFGRDGFAEADKTAALRHAHVVTASDTDDATALAVAALVITLLDEGTMGGAYRHRTRLGAESVLRHGAYFGSTMPGRPPSRGDHRRQPRVRLRPFDPRSSRASGAWLAAIVEARLRREQLALREQAVQADPRFGDLLFFHAASLSLGSTPLGERRPVARRYMEIVPSVRIRMLRVRLHVSAWPISSLKASGFLGLPDRLSSRSVR